MKTSLEIDDHLYQAARMYALREHTTVRALVERGLAAVIGLGPQAPEEDRASAELAELEALCAQVSALPLLTDESADQILGHDDDGGYA